MRVEKLELNGFKSFGDKTVLELHPGITCIVGPNGCGKSNVVDAFKWVLGEQSVKSLRGGKMEDVVFAGSQQKKPKGMAEVALHVRGLAPSLLSPGGNGGRAEATTVVSRRLYRSGESDYLLDRKRCRLRDIREVFLDTGLEVKSYSILEQDRISYILAARPEERRFLIEEVAGVIKYKIRRHEAMNKLDASRANLARIADITSEIKRQLNTLDRQARKAERYKKLMEELRGIELRIARTEYLALKESLATITEQHAEARRTDATLRANISQAEAAIEARRIEMAEVERQLEALQAELTGAERRLSEVNQSLAVSRTEREHLLQSIARFQSQGEENTRKRQEAMDRRDEIASTMVALTEEAANIRAAFERKQTEAREAQARVRDREHHLDTRRRDSAGVSDELSSMRNEAAKLRVRAENLQRQEAEVAREAEAVAAQLQRVVEARRAIEANMVGKNNELLILREERESLMTEIAGIRQRRAALIASIQATREALASAGSRLESLHEMDVAEATEEKLAEAVEVLASLSEVIESSKEFERAIESALGEAVNGFVLGSYADVRTAIEAIKAGGMGRTALVPSGADAAPEGQGQAPQGSRGWAADAVRVRGAAYEGIVRSMLAGVAVTGTLDEAIALRERGAARGLTLVTLEGEILTPHGAVVAGKGRGILTLKRQMRELTEEVERHKRTLEAGQKELAGLDHALAAREQEAAAMETRRNEAERALSILRVEAEKNTEEAERANRKQAHLKIEIDQIAKERQNIGAQIEQRDAKALEIEQRKSSVEQAIIALQEEIAGIRAAFEAHRTESVEFQLKLTQATERLGALEGEGKAIERLLSELTEKDGTIAREVKGTEERIETLAREGQDREGASRALALEAEGITRKITTVRDDLTARVEALREQERGLRSRRLEVDEASERLHALDVSRAEHTLRLENLVTNIRTTYEVELVSYEAEDPTDEDRAALPEIREKIEKMGPVSLGSIEEYEEIKQRYDFNLGHQQDLEKSIAELEEAISRINATTRKKLREAFEMLKAKFAEVFQGLFGGGRAELVLTDESNILETGIDVIAQPPGKRLQNISLLSGGEKTLTALALLFAGFLIKPTPLCILDEADAALDESNTQKFADLIKKLSRDVQFIVVTHNRVTMERADYIYGITMEEPGNSKAISLEIASA